MASKAQLIIDGLGGIRNIVGVAGCASRMRTEVADASKVDIAAIKAAGAFGVVKLGNAVQVVIGSDTRPVTTAIEDLMPNGGR